MAHVQAPEAVLLGASQGADLYRLMACRVRVTGGPRGLTWDMRAKVSPDMRLSSSDDLPPSARKDACGVETDGMLIALEPAWF